MSKTLTTFSPQNVSISWGGINLNGVADGTFIECVRNSDNSSQVVGAQGDVGLTFNADKTGQVTITFLQTSLSNVILSAAQAEQDLSGDLLRAPMVIRDKSGSFLAYISNAHIMTPAGMSLGQEQNSKAWVFYAERIDYADTIPHLGLPAGAAAEVASAISTLKSAALSN